jgi:hypothetical protein
MNSFQAGKSAENNANSEGSRARSTTAKQSKAKQSKAKNKCKPLHFNAQHEFQPKKQLY